MSERTNTEQMLPRSWQHSERWVPDLLALLLLAAAIRFAWLGRASLWSDEVFSIEWSQLDIRYLLGDGNRLETNPAGYYLLLKGWMAVFGTSAFAARSLSAVASSLAVLVIYAIGRRWSGRAFGLLAGVFLAFDPLVVVSARQGRGYALLGLVASIALLGLTLASRPGAGRRWPALVVFTLAVIATFFLHYTAVFFIAACFVGVGLGWLLVDRAMPARMILGWIVSAVVVAALLAGPLLNAMTMARSANLDWIHPLTLDDVTAYLRNVFLGSGAPGVVQTAAIAGLVLLIAAGLRQRRPTAAQAQVMIVAPVVFLVVLIGVSVSRPLLVPWTGVWLATPLCLLLAWSALAHPSQILRIGSIAVVMTMFVGLSARVLGRPPIEDWRATAQAVLADQSCQGPLVTIGPHVIEAEFYAPSLAKRATYWVRLSTDQPETAEAVLNRIVTHATPINPDDLAPFLTAHKGAALVYRDSFRRIAEAALAGFVSPNVATSDANFEAKQSDHLAGMHLICP